MDDEARVATKRRGWYAQIGVSQETFSRLTQVKKAKEKELGIVLSWNKFFILHLKELAEAEKK